MDIVGLLPVEVSRHILEYLRVVDLGKCLRVSKAWRDLANDDILWKHLSNSYGAPQIPDEPIYVAQPLCYWALVWKAFANSPAYKWSSKNYKSLEVARDDYTSVSVCGNLFTAYSQAFNNLDIFSVVKNSHRVKLITSLALYLPKDEEKASVCMSTDYVVAAKYNIVIVFKRNDSAYDLYKTFAIVFNSVIHATRDFQDFINTNLNLNTISGIYDIIEDYLWLSVDIEGTLVVNIETQEMTNIFSYENSGIQGKFFTTWSEDEVRIYTKEGRIAALIDNLLGLEDVDTNDTLVAIILGEVTGGCYIAVWELETGSRIFSKSMSSFTWTKLHPTDQILFTLESSYQQGLYRITAWSILNDNQLWVFEPGNSIFTSFWELNVICERYLVIWPSANNEFKFYLMEYKSGKLIYEADRPTHSDNYINDSLWISKGSKIQIRSYL